MALCMIMPAMADTQDKLNKQLAKNQQKEMKMKAKEYKKNGFQILGSRTMEVALLSHYTKLTELGDNGLVFGGVAERSKSKNLAEQVALNNATIKYANKCNSTVKGRVLSDNFTEGTTGEGEFEKFFSAYERIVEQKIKNVLIPSYSVVKQNPDGTYEVQSYFIVDETQAREARKTALENAIKESELAGKYADVVRGYANDVIAD